MVISAASAAASRLSSVEVLCSAVDFAGVSQLQQLHGPLDVGQSPAPQLGVRFRVGAARQPLGVDACLHPPDLEDRLGDTPPEG